MSFNIKTEVNWEEETCLAANCEQCGFLFDRMISIDEITVLTLGLKFAVRLSIDEGRDPIFEIKPMPGIEVLNGVDIHAHDSCWVDLLSFLHLLDSKAPRRRDRFRSRHNHEQSFFCS